jgi:hypothetical protein
MTTPRNKNWPEVQTVDGSLGVTGIVSVQNPTIGGMPPIKVPLEVTMMNTVLPGVTPLVPNFPVLNIFKAQVPEDGSYARLLLQTTDMITEPYFFRDVEAAGDVQEFCGNFLPLMRVYFYNPLYATTETYLRYTTRLLSSTANVFAEATAVLSMGFLERGMLELPDTIHCPSKAKTGFQHQFKIEVSTGGVAFVGKMDVEVLLCSHYDLYGSMPA